VVLVGGEGELAVALRKAGVLVFVGAAWRQRNFFKCVPLAIRIILGQEIALVHSCMQSGHLVGGSAALLTRRPVVCFNHGPIGNQRVQGLAPFIPADCVMVASQYMEAQQRRYASMAKRIVRVPLGLNAAAWRHDPENRRLMRQRYGLTQNEIALSVFGRLVRVKGHEVILRAFARAQREYGQALRLFIVGGEFCGFDPGYEEEIRALIRSLKLEDGVVFTGYQSDVAPWYDLTDIVLHGASGEPFGLVVAEAMLKERIVVVPDQGGPAEIVKDGVTGFHYSAGDAGSLAVALLRAIASRDDTSLRGCARASIATRYPASASIQCLEAEYANVLSGHQR
jgi:glycosyltransferase involved in cell wall biosynthesis